jgi:hypothetical protein
VRIKNAAASFSIEREALADRGLRGHVIPAVLASASGHRGFIGRLGQ